MKFDFTKLSKFQRYALVAMVSEKHKKSKEEIDAWYKKVNEEGMDFEVIANGTEFNILDVLARLEKVFTKEVEKRASDIVEEKVQEVFSGLDDFVYDVKKAIQDRAREKLGIDIQEEET